MATQPETTKPAPQIMTTPQVRPAMNFLYQFLDYAPNPDLLLQQTGETIAVYREMLLDGRIASLLDLRCAEVLEHPWQLEPADDSARAREVCDFVESCYRNMNIYQEHKELLSAIGFGFAFSEVVWKEPAGGRWIPDRLCSRRQERFGFRRDGTPYLVDEPGQPTLDLPFKFIVHRHDPQAENPWGTAVLSRCYWPWMFKKAGWRFWLQAADRFGVPSIFALFDCTDQREAATRATELANQLASVRSNGTAAFANIKELSTVEMKGSLDSFDALRTAANNEIAYAITGQSLATAEAEFGTRSQAEVHERVIDAFTKGDARELAWTENQTIIRWLAELNFGAGAPLPRKVYDFEQYASLDSVLKAAETGLPVSRSLTYERYGIPKPVDDKDAFVGTGQQTADAPASEGIDLADQEREQFPDQAAIDAAAADLDPAELQELAEGLLAPVIKLIEECRDFDEVQQRLAEAYPDMDDDTVEQMLSRALFVAETWGRLHADD